MRTPPACRSLSQRLTVVPSLFLAMKFLSRSSFISVAIRSSAKSQETSLEFVRARRAIFGDLEPGRRVDDVEQRRSLRAERAAIDRMVGIALDVDDVGHRILGSVAKAVDQDAAGDGAIGAGVAGLARGRELERPHRSCERLAGEAEAQCAKTGSCESGAGDLDEAATTELHGRALLTFRPRHANKDLAIAE